MVKVTIKKFGKSAIVVLPKEFLKENNLKVDDEVSLSLIKESDLSDIFGIMKGKLKMTGQEFKNMVRDRSD